MYNSVTYIVCTLHCVITTQSQLSFLQHIFDPSPYISYLRLMDWFRSLGFYQKKNMTGHWNLIIRLQNDPRGRLVVLRVAGPSPERPSQPICLRKAGRQQRRVLGGPRWPRGVHKPSSQELSECVLLTPRRFSHAASKSREVKVTQRGSYC